MSTIDTKLCEDLLREITKKIAAAGPKFASSLRLEQQIAHVCKASKEAEARLRSHLEMHYPDIGWTGEDDRPHQTDYWLYDPIDGAYHYLQGLPLWSASLVLVRNGEAVFSIVYDPILDEMFIALRNGGASCNGVALHASAKTELKAAVVGSAISPLAQVGQEQQDEALSLIRSVARSVFVVRPMAAASLQLAYVAAGRLDAYADVGQDAADWFAGALLVREASGLVTDLRGGEFGWTGEGILAGGNVIQPALRASITTAQIQA